MIFYVIFWSFWLLWFVFVVVDDDVWVGIFLLWWMLFSIFLLMLRLVMLLWMLEKVLDLFEFLVEVFCCSEVCWFFGVNVLWVVFIVVSIDWFWVRLGGCVSEFEFVDFLFWMILGYCRFDMVVCWLFLVVVVVLRVLFILFLVFLKIWCYYLIFLRWGRRMCFCFLMWLFIVGLKFGFVNLVLW